MNKIFLAGVIAAALTVLGTVTTLCVMMIGLVKFGPPPTFFWIGLCVSLWLIVVGAAVEFFRIYSE